MQSRFFIRVFLGFAAFFLVYNVVVAAIRPNLPLDYEAGERNVIIAERYLLRPAPNAVLVGSSMSRRLGYIDGGFENLALDGEGPLTGLDLVLRRSAHPQKVYVETNWLWRPLNKSFVGDVADEPWATLRRLLPGLRHENRPINLLTARTPHEPLPSVVKLDPAVKDNEDPGVAVSVAWTVEHHGRATDELRHQADRAAEVLRNQVDALRSRKVNVVLLWMPMHPLLAASPMFKYARDALERELPAGRYEWLDIEDGKPFMTVDSIHLTGPSALRVAEILRRRASGHE
jgi:hypothetical protein